MSYTFVWNRENSLVQLPVKIAKCVDNNYGIKGKLVCNSCETPVKQLYTCPTCDWKGTIGDIKKRLDEENEVVYEHSKKKAFMNSEIETSIKTVAEISLSEVLINIELVSGYYELYNNKSNISKETINKIHKWLVKNKKGLLVQFGYREKNRAGIVLPSKDKLLLAEVRDHRLIRGAKQQGIAPIQTKIGELIQTVTEDKEPELYETFIEKIKSGDNLDIAEVTERDEEVIVEANFLEE